MGGSKTEKYRNFQIFCVFDPPMMVFDQSYIYGVCAHQSGAQNCYAWLWPKMIIGGSKTEKTVFWLFYGFLGFWPPYDRFWPKSWETILCASSMRTKHSNITLTKNHHRWVKNAKNRKIPAFFGFWPTYVCFWSMPSSEVLCAFMRRTIFVTMTLAKNDHGWVKTGKKRQKTCFF